MHPKNIGNSQNPRFSFLGPKCPPAIPICCFTETSAIKHFILHFSDIGKSLNALRIPPKNPHARLLCAFPGKAFPGKAFIS